MENITVRFEEQLKNDIEYFLKKYLEAPTNSRVYKNLIQVLEAHHIYEIAKKENDK